MVLLLMSLKLVIALLNVVLSNLFFLVPDVVVNNANVINDCVIAGLLPNLLSYCQMLLLSMSAFPSPTDTIKDLRNYCLKNYHLRKGFTRK